MPLIRNPVSSGFQVEAASKARLLSARPNAAVSVQLTALDVLLALFATPSWKGGDPVENGKMATFRSSANGHV